MLDSARLTLAVLFLDEGIHRGTFAGGRLWKKITAPFDRSGKFTARRKDVGKWAIYCTLALAVQERFEKRP